MTDLHWALLSTAAVLLIGLFFYGKWQERKALSRLDDAMRRGVRNPLAEPHAVAVGSGRIEPRFAATADDDEPAMPPVAADSAPLPATDSAPDRGDSAAYALADGWIEDPLLDFVLELRCAHPIDGVAALDARGQLERLELPLPVHLAVWEPRTQKWSGPDRFGFYSEILATVQMANRRNALGEIDASRFVAAVQQIAMAVDADFDGPDVARLVAQAADLDRLCARFDVQITLTVETTPPVDRNTLAVAATELGLASAGPLRWERRSVTGPVFAMTPAGNPSERIALSLDVPLVPADAFPLSHLFSCAERLAARLDGRIVDDNGRVVQAGAQAAIEAQLVALYADMRVAGIEPGSLRARRLYAA